MNDDVWKDVIEPDAEETSGVVKNAAALSPKKSKPRRISDFIVIVHQKLSRLKGEDESSNGFALMKKNSKNNDTQLVLELDSSQFQNVGTLDALKKFKALIADNKNHITAVKLDSSFTRNESAHVMGAAILNYAKVVHGLATIVDAKRDTKILNAVNADIVIMSALDQKEIAYLLGQGKDVIVAPGHLYDNYNRSSQPERGADGLGPYAQLMLDLRGMFPGRVGMEISPRASTKGDAADYKPDPDYGHRTVRMVEKQYFDITNSPNFDDTTMPILVKYPERDGEFIKNMGKNTFYTVTHKDITTKYAEAKTEMTTSYHRDFINDNLRNTKTPTMKEYIIRAMIKGKSIKIAETPDRPLNWWLTLAKELEIAEKGVKVGVKRTVIDKFPDGEPQIDGDKFALKRIENPDYNPEIEHHVVEEIIWEHIKPLSADKYIRTDELREYVKKGHIDLNDFVPYHVGTQGIQGMDDTEVRNFALNLVLEKIKRSGLKFDLVSGLYGENQWLATAVAIALNKPLIIADSTTHEPYGYLVENGAVNSPAGGEHKDSTCIIVTNTFDYSVNPDRAAAILKQRNIDTAAGFALFDEQTRPGEERLQLKNGRRLVEIRKYSAFNMDDVKAEILKIQTMNHGVRKAIEGENKDKDKAKDKTI